MGHSVRFRARITARRPEAETTARLKEMACAGVVVPPSAKTLTTLKCRRVIAPKTMGRPMSAVLHSGA
jgi:hypothetical protein